jgi:putative nucleotidyltransferase with HDIG domain
MHAEIMFTKIKTKKSADQRYIPYLDPDHPLLLELQEKSFGTYRHSIMVGSMAATSAQKIGANADLARAIGYYHDVGKIDHPDIFSESLSGRRRGPTRPVDLAGLNIILRHAQASRRMLEERGFPDEMCIAVEQHHGTLRTRVQLSPGIAGTIQPDQLFYAGPVPSFRESALVLFADRSQAMFEKMKESNDSWHSFPSKNFIRGFVEPVGLGLWEAGQFAGSGLTSEEYQIVKGNLTWWLFKFYNGLSNTTTPYADEMEPGEKVTPHAIRNHRRGPEEG